MLPITLTESAKDRIMTLVAKKPGCAGMILRIATGKGCGGNEYKWDYAETAPDGYDRLDVRNGIGVFISMADSFSMFGMTIDFATDAVGNAQFAYSNPNEKGRCGCGESVIF
jgi:iron-sulfur cluster assembly protein